MKSTTALAFLLAACSAVQQTEAAPVVAHFTAVVSSSESSDLPVVGASIQGSITFDYAPSTYTVTSDCGPACTSYSYTTSPYEYFVDLGTSQVRASYVGIAVSDNTNVVDPLAPVKDLVSFATKYQSFGYSLDLIGPSSALNGSTLPSADALSILGTNGYFRITSPSHTESLLATVTAISISAVPEPSSFLYFALGGLALIATIRRTDRTAR